jgi:phosphoglycolate phosphatase
VTNKPARFTLPLLESLGIDVDLATVVSGDTLPLMKPDPAPVLHALRACAVVPTDAVLIGDTITDINAARAAGVRSVWVSYGYSHGQDIDAAAPDARLHSLNELPTVFS